MNEAEPISASRGKAEVQTAVLTPALQGPAEAVARPKRRLPRLPPLIQGSLAIAATAVAFGPSLLWLPRALPALLLSLTPVLSVLLAALIALRHRHPEPDIHDRYLDYILGLALLGLATLSLLLLPSSLSIFFWSWRLDVMVVPLFLAGAIVLLAGARVLWRHRLPVALLVLCWPVSMDISLPPGWPASLTPGVPLPPWGRVGVGASLAMPFALLSLPVLIVFALHTFSRRHGAVPTGSSAARPGGGLVAAGLVVLATAVTALADQQVNAAAHLLGSDGRPLIVGAVLPPAAVGALHRINAANAGVLPSWGLKGTVAAYGDPAIALNRFLPADSRDLALPPAAIAQRQGYSLQGEQRVDLGDGLMGQLESYASPTGKTLLVIWWDWPVQASGGVARERVITEQIAARDTQPNRLLDFARAYIGSLASSAPLP